MKLIVDAPEELTKKDHFYTEKEKWSIVDAVQNGIPLDSISTISVGVDGKAVQIYPNNIVLDKIRDEIESHCGLTKENHCKYCSYCNSVMGVREILEIIDKYKSESEDKKCRPKKEQ